MKWRRRFKGRRGGERGVKYAWRVALDEAVTRVCGVTTIGEPPTSLVPFQFCYPCAKHTLLMALVAPARYDTLRIPPPGLLSLYPYLCMYFCFGMRYTKTNERAYPPVSLPFSLAAEDCTEGLSPDFPHISDSLYTYICRYSMGETISMWTENNQNKRITTAKYSSGRPFNAKYYTYVQVKQKSDTELQYTSLFSTICNNSGGSCQNWRQKTVQIYQSLTTFGINLSHKVLVA